jgi:heme-degrading monooxygenase HmoA
MPITVFRLKLEESRKEAYLEVAARMNELAPTMPGYISHKRFVADDGERVTIVEFADHDSQSAWANHPEHLDARSLGREKFFKEYDISVCDVVRRYRKP